MGNAITTSKVATAATIGTLTVAETVAVVNFRKRKDKTEFKEKECFM